MMTNKRTNKIKQNREKNKGKKKKKQSPPPLFQKLCGLETLITVERSLGVVGLAGLDRLLAFQIVHTLSATCREFKVQAKPIAAFLEHLQCQALDPEWLPPASSTSSSETAKFYAAVTKKLEPLAHRLGSSLLAVGHAQLLRKSITHALCLRSRLDASHLNSTLQALDASLLTDLMAHYQDPQHKPYPLDDDKKNILPELSKLLDASGLSEPFQTIYIATEPLSGLSVVLLVLFLLAAAKLDFTPSLATLVMMNKNKYNRSKQLPLDGFVLVVGVHTMLKQFHPAYTRQLLAYLSQFISSSLSGLGTVSSSKQLPTEIPRELSNMAWFIDSFCRVAQLPPPTHFLPLDILRALLPSSPSY
uniref:Uncharacterized protein n=1 Tax=Aureoumbra lagunensis TaxID=44058 RepID=A0A7S3NM04_9STRA